MAWKTPAQLASPKVVRTVRKGWSAPSRAVSQKTAAKIRAGAKTWKPAASQGRNAPKRYYNGKFTPGRIGVSQKRVYTVKLGTRVKAGLAERGLLPQKPGPHWAGYRHPEPERARGEQGRARGNREVGETSSEGAGAEKAGEQGTKIAETGAFAGAGVLPDAEIPGDIGVSLTALAQLIEARCLQCAVLPRLAQWHGLQGAGAVIAYVNEVIRWAFKAGWRKGWEKAWEKASRIIAELQAIIRELRARIAALEARIAQLEGEVQAAHARGKAEGFAEGQASVPRCSCGGIAS